MIYKYFSCIKKFSLFIYTFVLSLIPVFWISKGYIIAGGDDNPFLNPASYVDLSSWDNSGFANTFNLGYSRIFPHGVFWLVLQNIGFSNSLIQQLWLFLIWFISGLSIIYLVKIFFLKNYQKICIFAIPLYLLIPFNTFITITIALKYVQAFLPLMLGLFIKGLTSTNKNTKIMYAILFAFTSLFATPAFSNMANGSILLLVPLIYFIYSFLDTKKDKVFFTQLLFVLGSFVLFFLFNLYWIWTIFNLSSVVSFMSSHNWGYFGTTSVFDTFRTLGGWAVAKDPMQIFEHSYYQSLGIVVSSFSIVFIAFTSLLFIKKEKNILFFLFLAAIAIFLVKGTLEPWGDIYKYFFEKFSFFKAFREPWTKFTPMYILSLSILFGFACSEILDFFKNQKYRLIPIPVAFILLFLVGVSGYPGIFGFNLWKYNFPGQRSVLIKVPQYWNDMVAFFNNNDPGALVYITPRSFSARDYNWSSGISGLSAFEYLFIKNPIRYASFSLVTQDYVYNGQFLAEGNFDVLNSPDFINYLNMLGVKYIIQENDVMWGPGSDGNYPPKLMQALLSKNEYVEKFRTFGKIDIYKVKDDFYRPMLYLARKIVFVNGPAFAFGSWRKAETDNFSLISSVRGLSSVDDPDFIYAYQEVVDGKAFQDAGDNARLYSINVKNEGDYDVYINIIDSKPTLFFPVSYSIDSGLFEDAKNVDVYDEVSKKYLSYLKTPDNFVTEYLGSRNLKAGEHKLSLKSPAFSSKDYGSIFYISFNKRFANTAPPLPNFKFRKIKETRYIIDVSGNNVSYVLNFAQDYDKGWNLYIVKAGEIVLLNVPHFVVNGINNGWYINADSVGNSKDYKLQLEFTAQRTFINYLIISVVSVVISLIFLIYFLFIARKVRKL